MIRKVLFLLLLGTLLFSGNAYALFGIGEDDEQEQQQSQAVGQQNQTGQVAQTGQQQIQRDFSQVDLDQDGNISQSEFQQAQLDQTGKSYQSLDIDKDGVISQREYEAAKNLSAGGMAEAEFGDVDVDEDGNISRDEFLLGAPDTQHEQAFAQSWDRFDVDRDGVLDEIEFEKAQQQIVQGSVLMGEEQQGMAPQPGAAGTR
jgi:Ca2+-binding EF-hand superfamily protein